MGKAREGYINGNKKGQGKCPGLFLNECKRAYLVQLPKFSVVRSWPSSKPAL